MTCIKRRCYSPVACGGFGYCREANIIAGLYRYVFEAEIPTYEAQGWLCVGTMPGHHAERGWIMWREA